ncbi:MAG: chemotaxis protein CheW, partial [Desulfococcaceae bacterium]
NIDLFDAYNDRDSYPKYLSKYPVLSPAEAKNIIAVGSLCKKSTNTNIIVSKNTRLGIHPVFLRDDLDKYRFFKPDLLTYGGNSELKLNQDRIAVSKDLEIATINNKGDLVEVRGEFISYLSLRERFGHEGDTPNIQKVVVMRAGGQLIALGVDHVVGQHQTVIKSLGKMYRDVKSMSGATILGDGTVALILDVDRMVEAAQKQGAGAH